MFQEEELGWEWDRKQLRGYTIPKEQYNDIINGFMIVFPERQTEDLFILTEDEKLWLDAELAPLISNGIAVKIPEAFPDGAFVPKHKRQEESRCSCGGPAGHLPGGIYCRKKV